MPFPFKGQLIEHLRQLRSSYWFIPSLMAITAVFAAQASIEFDQWMGPKWLDAWGFLYANKPEGARALLSTIAGSMIGVAGVTFSITIAAVAYASSQFGPRIIDNFMKDRGNQITLGTFISTFIYCLLVLRIVRSGPGDTGFVPHGSVFVGVILAVASLAVLIYFIHHIPDSIHISRLVASIGHELLERIDDVYPEKKGSEQTELQPDTSQIDLSTPTCLVRSGKDGHIQSLDIDALTSLAGDREILLYLTAEPGDFIVKGQLLAKVYGKLEPKVEKTIANHVVIGDERSPTQDLLYLSDQLIDIAGRALSPGVNDPQTAISCIHWLHATLAHLGHRQFSSRYRTTEHGKPVLVTKERCFETFVDSFYDQLRQYVERDRNASLATLKCAINTMECLPPAECIALRRAATHLVEGCLNSFSHKRDLDQLQEFQRQISFVNTSENQLKKALSNTK
jgi:uncharacterized membrane protein